MKAKCRVIAALAFVALVGSACSPSPLFVRDSTYRESDIKFLVSDGATQYIVRCDWAEIGAELKNCRKLVVRFEKSANPGGGT